MTTPQTTAKQQPVAPKVCCDCQQPFTTTNQAVKLWNDWICANCMQALDDYIDLLCTEAGGWTVTNELQDDWNPENMR
jgi:predicted amidophosphoribosyltransferase